MIRSSVRRRSRAVSCLFASLLIWALSAGLAHASIQASVVWRGTAIPVERASNWLQLSRVSSPPVVIEFAAESCPEFGPYSSCTTYWIDQQPDGSVNHRYLIQLNPDHGRRLFEHEIGHVFEYSGALDEWAKAQLMPLFRLTDWNSVTASERFAEAYSFCAVGGDSWGMVVGNGYYGFHLRPAALTKACRIIRRSALRTIPAGLYL